MTKYLLIIFFYFLFPSFSFSQSDPRYLTFCDEPVPIGYQFVRKRLEVALSKATRNEARLGKLRVKADFYFPYVEAMLKKHKIPGDFKYLPIVESELSGSALSPAGAGGFWQLMPGTAKELGLTVHNIADERESIVRSTIAACKHIQYLFNELKDWTLVAAAYNVGLGSIQSSMRKQKIKNYYFLSLNAETADYVYNILAIKILFERKKASSSGDNNIKPETLLIKSKPGFNRGIRKFSNDLAKDSLTTIP